MHETPHVNNPCGGVTPSGISTTTDTIRKIVDKRTGRDYKSIQLSQSGKFGDFDTWPAQAGSKRVPLFESLPPSNEPRISQCAEALRLSSVSAAPGLTEE
jgi:hypothetical protein